MAAELRMRTAQYCVVHTIYYKSCLKVTYLFTIIMRKRSLSDLISYSKIFFINLGIGKNVFKWIRFIFVRIDFQFLDFLETIWPNLKTQEGNVLNF